MQESNTLSEVSCYTTLSGHSEEEAAGTTVGSVASVATLTQEHGVSCSLASKTRLVETQCLKTWRWRMSLLSRPFS